MTTNTAAAPNTLDRFFDRLSDHLNPIMVKETRQALKSRQFLGTFMLLLLVAWLISALGVFLAGGAIEFGSPARAFFLSYVYVLEFAVLLIVPFSTFRSMHVEREHNTYELLSISTLKPKQIVWGKLGSSVVQIFLYYSAIAPFVAFTSLLQGFDMLITAFMLVALLIWSLITCMICLMLSAVSDNRNWQTLNMLGILILLVWQLISSFVLATFILMENLPFEQPEFWWAIGLMVLATVSYFVVFQQITVSRLTFESDNRSTGIRLACAAQFYILWISLFAMAWQFKSRSLHFDQGVFEFAATVSCLHWGVVGLFAVTEPDFISRRIRRGVPTSSLMRLFYAIWMPGGARAFAYILFHLGLTLLGVVLSDLYFAPASATDRYFTYTLAAVFYVINFLAYGAAIGRAAAYLSPQVRPAHSRVIIVLLGAMAFVAPLIPPAFDLVRVPYGTYSMIYISNPVMTLSHVDRNPGDGMTEVILLVLATGAFVGALLNLPSMGRGLWEIVAMQRVAPSRSTPVVPAASTEESSAPALE